MASDNPFSELVGLIKSWIPWRSEPSSVSRDFWMPDQSCRVCYECDVQFTLINRKHHCRLCGRVFCARCTANSIPIPSSNQRTPREEWERIRVCNYCFKQWQQGVAIFDNGIQLPGLDISSSQSEASLVSTKSTGTANSSSFTFGSMPQSTGPTQRGQLHGSDQGIQQRTVEPEPCSDKNGGMSFERSNTCDTDGGYRYPNQHFYSMNRSDDDDDEYGIYRSDSETRHFPQVNGYYNQVEFDDMSNDDGSHKTHLDGETLDSKSLSSSPFNLCFGSQGLEGLQQQIRKKDEHDTGDDHEAPTSEYPVEDSDNEPVDFENNGLLWLPPEPEDEEDEIEGGLFDDDDNEGEDGGEWGYLRPSGSFGSGEFRNREKSGEEQKQVMKNVVDGHFRALVSQLLQVENIPVGSEGDEDNWLDIVSSLSWEAATLLKPDMSQGGGMDPGGYVKVKCIASGRRCESMVVKGVVCKKNVSHRRMTTTIDKPRLLILGGALEYQRVANSLSSVDTLLQQEMDHLKMAVAKIDAHQPDILLVEKSVSRYAQEYLLAKDISLVLNIKRPLLERIARCTGAQIVPSIDHLSSPKLGYCESFHVDKVLEVLGSAGQAGKELVKTLMFFEGCPKPLGFTVLLRGANGDELKKVKHVVQYGVFAAYHLALETSFLADEGASLPELPLNSPINVALPDKPSHIERSISTVHCFSNPASEKPQEVQPSSEPQRSYSVPAESLVSAVNSVSTNKFGRETQNVDPACQSMGPISSCKNTTKFLSTVASTVKAVSDSYRSYKENDGNGPRALMVAENSAFSNGMGVTGPHLSVNGYGKPLEGGILNGSYNDPSEVVGSTVSGSQRSYEQENGKENPEMSSTPLDQKDGPKEARALKEEFPPSPSDHQSILVSLSSRCVWKGTVCERSHLFRIKYYGSFDKPLGRYLRDHLFDQSYTCQSCEMPSEAHVHCYTHRQGTLTISVKKLPEILLPGAKDGKIWMWHRCLRCPRTNGFPPATRRVVMSDAAWGLSFGKFLELSFSNHAAASRVASCGHSLHRDCLRFYGFGQMVACFRYASIDVLSVYLPPPKVDFNFDNQKWIQKEIDEVANRAELLFSEVLNALSQILEKRSGAGPLTNGTKTNESRRQIAELEVLLQKEKAEFEESLQKILNKEVTKGQSVVDILEINRLRRQLLFQSYVWDHRLIYASNSQSNNLLNDLDSSHKDKDQDGTGIDESDESGKEFNIYDSFPVDATNPTCDQLGELSSNSNLTPAYKFDQEVNKSQDSDDRCEGRPNLSTSKSVCDQPNNMQPSSIRRTLSEGQAPSTPNLSDSLDAAWIGENNAGIGILKDKSTALSDSASGLDGSDLGDNGVPLSGPETGSSFSHTLSTKSADNVDYSVSWIRMPFLNFYRSLNKNFFTSSEKLDTLGEYTPVYVSFFRELELKEGARLLLPVGVNDTVIPVYDDEPTSIIAYALTTPEYHGQLIDEGERMNDTGNFSASFSFSDMNSHLVQSIDEMGFDRSLGSTDESILSLPGSRSSLVTDPLSFTKAMHARVSFGDDGARGKVKYSVTCYYAKRFEALRRMCCPSELDFVRSLSRCKKWGAQGGKSNVFFAKTLDDRFIIKQVTKTELESFSKFAPEYFKYLSESIGSRSPTCLAKILGIYQVTARHLKGGRESKMDVLVMENLLFGRNVTRLYDLKGSSRSRYNPDSSGSNKVLLDQNLLEAMPTSPIFVGNKAKRLLERAVWNDTSFLASIDVMDYSLLVGMDEERHELVLGIIDFMRQYTWDKHLETWVKASGILGGPKNVSPTVISPKQYKKRFRKAMTTYFLMVPDQWSPPTIIPSTSQSDLCKENSLGSNSVE